MGQEDFALELDPGLSGSTTTAITIWMGLGILCLQWGPLPSHHRRMLRGARPSPGVGLLEHGQPPEEAEASRRAVGTREHPSCRAVAGGSVRYATALWGSRGNAPALDHVLSCLTCVTLAL